MQVESISVSPVLTSSAFEFAGHRPTPASSDSPKAPGAKSEETPAAVSTNRGEQSLEKAIHAIDEAVKEANLSLDFSRDDETGAIVIKLIDQQTGEAVQQIPSVARLHLAAALGKLQGQIFSRKA
jgi:flagellar protein FlaG